MMPRLQGCLDSLELVLSDEQKQRLLDYLALLMKWNQAYNLTAIRDAQEMLVKHLFDALSVAPFLPESGHWLDVGSGGGIPGLVLAIAGSERQWTLLDSNGKKTRFLTQASIELGLKDQVTVVNARAENHQGCYDGVIARAVMETGDFIQLTEHLCVPTGAWWLMKGVFPQSELTQVPSRFSVSCQKLSVPELDAERWLVKAVRG
jgi:16S rRNA (guanine527-N7)-methyltransferase